MGGLHHFSLKLDEVLGEVADEEACAAMVPGARGGAAALVVPRSRRWVIAQAVLMVVAAATACSLLVSMYNVWRGLPNLCAMTYMRPSYVEVPVATGEALDKPPGALPGAISDAATWGAAAVSSRLSGTYRLLRYIQGRPGKGFDPRKPSGTVPVLFVPGHGGRCVALERAGPRLAPC